ncbi:Blastoderm-specific protein 25D [Eumeta japonica]|uniref:Blastoderm-specific protein 25D n=1 Tax=Eumeta variegata TaxID=151549 RepID=A0A4C1WRK5_EUMVA|nr:Blastoderm-specific protein 25D [Eumeta japonica]
MDSVSMDHYEKQLYSVFKTFDIDNEESLDKAAVLDLCNALQLEGRSSALVNILFDRTAERVTFAQFRNGLLDVLGGGDATAATSAQLAYSDDDSSGREVAPKFIYGSKKYGRRSKPHGSVNPPFEPTNFSPESVSEDNMQGSKLNSTSTECIKNTLSINGISDNSHIGTLNCDLDHDKLIDYEEAVEICRNLHMDKIDKHLIERIFKEHQSTDPINKMTAGEFFHKLNTSLTISIASQHNDCALSNEVVLTDLFENSDINLVAMECIVEMWEKCGVEHGQQLLQELGFTTSLLSLKELISALEEEFRILTQEHAPMDAKVLLLQALIALYRLQVSKVKQSIEHLSAENTKLKNDLIDANKRAQVLAQEVDENHARMETSLKNKIKQLEIRHADSMKVTVSEWATEKEKMSGIISQLEGSITRLSAEENRLRIENVTLNKQIDQLKKKVIDDEERLSELDSIRVQLTKELKLISIERKVETLSKSSREWRRISLSRSAPHSLDISAEQAESWRDEAESVGERPGKRRGECHNTPRTLPADDIPRACKFRKKHDDSLVTCDTDSSSEGPSSLPTPLPLLNAVQDCDMPNDYNFTFINSMDIMKRLKGIAESLQELQPNSCGSCNTLKSILATIQELITGFEKCVVKVGDSPSFKSEVTVATQTDNSEVLKLQDELDKTHKQYAEEKLKLTNLAKDLEASLEQLKNEYDKSEEYWTSKLEEEREVYNEEQRLSDERLTELIAKIGEYERQFSPRVGLPAIDERYSLELQVQDVEQEYHDYRKEKEKELIDKIEEIERLKEKIQSLERSNLPNGNDPISCLSGASSPIEYLWSQGTIRAPYTNPENSKRNSVRDYHNPAYVQTGKEDITKCSSDSEKDKSPDPIQRPALSQRSNSVGALQDHVKPPAMIQCSELEGQLRRQHLQTTPVTVQSVGGVCSCGPAALERRCGQLLTALRHHQLYLDSVQRAAAAEAMSLRARVASAEAAAVRLQQRLAAADLLVKELYLENCQLAHHPAAAHSRALL